MRPSTNDVLKKLAGECIVVGSFCELGEAAKDIDVVIPEWNDYGRNPIFRNFCEAFSGYVHSNSCGHLAVDADPQMVEIFEGSVFAINHNKTKPALDFESLCEQASGRINAHGVTMKFWSPPAT